MFVDRTCFRKFDALIINPAVGHMAIHMHEMPLFKTHTDQPMSTYACEKTTKKTMETTEAIEKTMIYSVQ